MKEEEEEVDLTPGRADFGFGSELLVRRFRFIRIELEQCSGQFRVSFGPIRAVQVRFFFKKKLLK